MDGCQVETRAVGDSDQLSIMALALVVQEEEEEDGELWEEEEEEVRMRTTMILLTETFDYITLVLPIADIHPFFKYVHRTRRTNARTRTRI